MGWLIVSLELDRVNLGAQQSNRPNGSGAKAEIARELAYRLYTVCERKKRATEALSYNGLVQSWPEIGRLARASAAAASEPAELTLF